MPQIATLGQARNLVTTTENKLAATKARMARIVEESKSKIEGGMRVVKVNVSGGGASYLTARFGKVGAPAQLFGLDADMLAGGAITVAALLDWGGEYNDHLYDVGAGVLTSYSVREAWQAGIKAQTPAAATGGVQPPSAWAPRRAA